MLFEKVSILSLVFLFACLTHRSETRCNKRPIIFKTCPGNWSLQFDRCYYYNSNYLDYINAEAFCKSKGGNLIIIRNDDEFDYMSVLCPNPLCYFMVGAKASVPLAFSWTDGTPIDRNNKWWGSDEPDNGQNNVALIQGCIGTYVASDKYHFMYDIACTDPYNSICEKPVQYT